MSDYGSSITITKKDKSAISETEKSLVEALLIQIQNTEEYFDVLGNVFLFELNDVENDESQLHLVFSKYSYGNGIDEESFEFAKDFDFEQVEEIAEKMNLILEDSFTVIPSFQNW